MSFLKNLQHYLKRSSLKSFIIPSSNKMDKGLAIRNATYGEMKLFLEWANSEGWNESEADLNAFYHIDPQGFFLGEVNGEPVSMIQAVAYNNYAHLAFYIVKKEFRGKGYGYPIWQHAIKYVEGKVQVLGLDAVEQEKKDYEKSGFKVSGALTIHRKKAQGTRDKELLDIRDLPLDEIVEYDEKIFGSSRRGYIEAILNEKSHGFAIKKDGQIKGYGILKKAQISYRLAPLVAENQEFAQQILNGLQSLVEGEDVDLYTYESNKEAQSLVQGWKPMYTFQRMYKNGVPQMNTSKLFGNIPEVA